MNAQEAANKTKQNLESSIPQQEYDSLMTRIEYLISVGEFLTWEESLSKKTIERLKNEKYKVNKCIGGGYNITWNHIKI
jgi:hypothetical protein